MQQRNKPSSKAREKGYQALGGLFFLFKKLTITDSWQVDDDTYFADYMGWKQWVIKYTPPDKRGGLNRSRHKSDRN